MADPLSVGVVPKFLLGKVSLLGVGFFKLKCDGEGHKQLPMRNVTKYAEVQSSTTVRRLVLFCNNISVHGKLSGESSLIHFLWLGSSRMPSS